MVILPIIILAVIAAFIVNVVQVKWKVTFKPLRPKPSKLNVEKEKYVVDALHHKTAKKTQT